MGLPRCASPLPHSPPRPAPSIAAPLPAGGGGGGRGGEGRAWPPLLSASSPPPPPRSIVMPLAHRRPRHPVAPPPLRRHGGSECVRRERALPARFPTGRRGGGRAGAGASGWCRPRREGVSVTRRGSSAACTSAAQHAVAEVGLHESVSLFPTVYCPAFVAPVQKMHYGLVDCFLAPSQHMNAGMGKTRCCTV